LKELLLIVAERDWYRVVQGDAQQCQGDTVVYRKAYHKTYRIVLVDTGERINVQRYVTVQKCKFTSSDWDNTQN